MKQVHSNCLIRILFVIVLVGECKRLCTAPEIEDADIQIYQPARIGMELLHKDLF